MYQTIIVPLDGSPTSEAAIPVAARLARGAGATLELVRVHRPTRADLDQHVVWSEVVRNLQRKYFASLAQRYEPTVGRHVVTTLLEAPVVSALCEHASGRPAPLVVMTMRGRTGFRRAVLGSVSDGLIRHGSAPVLVLRQRRRDGRQLTWKRPDGAFHTIAVPLDGTAVAEEAFPTPDESSLIGDDLVSGYLERVTDRIIAEGGQLAITTETELSDHPAAAIADCARQHDADLIVMATHGRGGSRLIHGSVADGMLRTGPDAILFVRPVDASLP